VRSGRIRAGERVLDVACGTGNTAIMARARGAAVTGLDLTPELLAVAQKRAAEEGYGDITWKVGDAEDLPFPDGTFDVVVSSCGLMFAPDQQKVADEVARVTKPGGRIAIQAWTREGGVGRMLAVTGAYVPPPAGVPSPFEWGDEEKVRRLFGSSFRDYRFEHYDCPEYTDTPEQLAELFINQYGPTHRVYRTLPPDKAAAFRKDLTDLYRGYVTPADGKVRWGREYLVTLATRA
jgi:SAM-dependent methyltransferase